MPDMAVKRFFDDLCNSDNAIEISVSSVHEKYAPKIHINDWLFLVDLHYQDNPNLADRIDLRRIEHRERPGYDNWVVTDLVFSKKGLI